MQNINKLWQLRTDLAYDSAREYSENQINGFQEIKEVINNVPVVKHIIDENASKEINKPSGHYYTIDLSDLNYHDHIVSNQIEDVITHIMEELINKYNLNNKSCLIVGLGNDNVTPDAIGPYTIDNIVVTRHLALNEQISDGYSVVSAISPGVMGTTGVETYDIIEAVKSKINVDYLVVVDALASSNVARVNRTIQITDTGIAPGSGVGNKRKEISLKTMNIPVFAIGIPTVVDAASIAINTLDYVAKYLNLEYLDKMPNVNKLSVSGIPLEYEKIAEPNHNVKEHFLGKIGILSENDQKDLFTTILSQNGYNLMVTTKDIDLEVEDLSKIIAWGLNKTFHKTLKEEEN